MTGHVVDSPPLGSIEIDPVAGVEELVRQSLLVPMFETTAEGVSEARFGMLETIQEFAQAQLAASGEEDATRAAHAAWTLWLADQTHEAMSDHRRGDWGRRVEAELGNIRAALAWAESRGRAEAELALRLPQALRQFWDTHGLVAEGRKWLQQALELDAGPDWDRQTGWNVLGLFAWIQGDLDAAEAALSRSEGFWRSIENNVYLPQNLLFRSFVRWTRGDISRVDSLVQEALERYLDWNGLIGAGLCQIMLAVVAYTRGNYDRARSLLDLAYATLHRQWFGWGIATSRLYAGEVERARGDPAQAAALFDAAIDLYREHHDPWGTGAAIAGLATLAAGAGNFQLTARLLGAAKALREKARAFLPLMDQTALSSAERAARASLGDRYQRLEDEGRAWPLDRVIAETRQLARGKDVVSDNPALNNLIGGAQLTRRERDVLELIAAGHSNEEIASSLFISVRTAERPIREALAKIGLSRRELIAAYAAQSAGSAGTDLYRPRGG